MASNVAHSPRIAQDISALGHGMFHPMPVTTTPIPASLPRMNILDCVEQHVMDRLQIPQNLIVYIFSLPHQLPQRRLYEIQDRLDQWVEWDTLTSLANYRSVVEILFSILCDILLRHSLRSRHAIAEEVFERLREDVFAVYEQLTSILRDSETYKSFYACRGALAQQLLDLLQDLLDAFPDSSARPLLSKALLRLSHASGLHPTCFALSGLQKVGQQVAAGAFGDVWKGLVRGQSVCVKIVRLFRDADVKAALQGFSREALIWRQLSHPNLLPFFGLYYLDSRLCLVSPWMENGHIIEFLRNAPADTNRASLMLDIARGLEYLHCKRVVHGDLKGMNILVTPSRRACVADFGLSSIADALTLRFTHSTASAQRGTVRYQAPELILAESPNHFASDVYAFACVCYEILTGKVPFYEISQDVAVMYKVVQGLRPSPPETMPLDSLWVLLQDCWEQKSANRPDVTQIIQRLVGPPIGAKTTHSTTDWDETFSSRFRRSLQDWPLLPLVTGIERRIFGEELAEACVECFPPPVTTPKNQDSRAESSSKRPPLSPSSDYPPPAPALKVCFPSPISSSANDLHNWEPPSVHNGVQSTQWTRVTLPISCLTDHHVSVHTDDRPPQMCHVFVSTDDLTVHRDTPRNLRPPQLLPSQSPQQATSSKRAMISTEFDASLCESYLKMRSQTPAEASTSSIANADPMWTIRAPPASPAYGLRRLPTVSPQQNLGSDFDDRSPLFASSSDGFLTSPMDTPALTASSMDGSPSNELLATPPLWSDLNEADIGEYSDGDLFGGPSDYDFTAAPVLPPPETTAPKLRGTREDWKPDLARQRMRKEEEVKRRLDDTTGPLNLKKKRI